MMCLFFFFFKQKTAYEMRISDWSSDVCSSDLWLLIAGALLLIACLRGLADRQTAFDASWRLALAVGVAMMLATLAGHYWILSAYDLSADERLANFDAAILAKGQLVAPLPAQWWDNADSIHQMSMFITDHREPLASAYLPVNA